MDWAPAAKPKSMISLVIPTFNEKANVEPLLQRVEAALARSAEPFEVIVVDDASGDGTAAEVQRLRPGRAWLRLIERSDERDLSTAVVSGWRAARGDLLGCMDADLQHPPEVLRDLIASLRNGDAGIAIASRYRPGGGVGDWNPLRRAVSSFARWLTEIALRARLRGATDPMSGYFLVRRSALELSELRPRGYKILLEVLARSRCERIVEVPFTFALRENGRSKLGARTVWNLLLQLARLSRVRPPDGERTKTSAASV
jgi:dolichol-phosphate mannosyltransferase